MRGASVCRLHGGKAPQVRRAAERRVALAEARRFLGVPREVDPSVESVHEAAGNVATLRGRLQEAETEGQDAVRVDAVRELYAEERDRLARMAKLAHDAGIEDRRVELAEAQGELVATVILAALSDPEWFLPPAAQEAGRAVLGRHLRRLGPGVEIVNDEGDLRLPHRAGG